jgi:hypothetical protein
MIQSGRKMLGEIVMIPHLTKDKGGQMWGTERLWKIQQLRT